MKEIQGSSVNGYLALFIILGGFASSIFVVLTIPSPFMKVIGVLFFLVSCVCLVGFYMVQPNQSRVLTLFGEYVGSVTNNGLRWSNPFYLKNTISLRVKNFESSKLKVNDNHGNPIEIGAVVVWSVTNTAEAVFLVDDYESYVTILSEAAIRSMASAYPYDLHDGDDISLRSHPEIVSNALVTEIQNRLQRAGVTVQEARISHLAYSPEIASAMLQRQQASAIIAARKMIVEGAVGMVEMALTKLSERGVVELDEERKATMVSNLLVVLCGDKSAQPIVNAGSLY